MNYPDKITEEILTNAVNVTDQEVLRDIADTEKEIVVLTAEQKGHEQIAAANPSSSQGKMSALIADGKHEKILHRQNFINFLTLLMEARNKPALDTA